MYQKRILSYVLSIRMKLALVRLKEKLLDLYQKYLSLPLSKRIAIPIGIVAISAILFVIFLNVLVRFGAFGPLPSYEEIRNIKNPLSSEIYSDDETLIGRYYVENRSPLSINDLNDSYKNALIATEDARFYKHGGVDYRSLIRVFFKSILLQNDNSGGGSTITQQLAKNIYKRKKYKLLSTVINKLREMAIAKRLEKVYSKEDIILMYSNTVSFGERAFGLSTAAKRFYNKKPNELTLSEAATLVGILKATTYYSPRKNPDRAKQRRNTVLAQMVKYNYLNPNDTIGLLDTEIVLDYNPLSTEEELARYFKQKVRREFEIWNDTIQTDNDQKYKLEYDGLKIYTSLNYKMQIASESIIKSHLKNLQDIFEESWKGGRRYGKGTKIIDDYILSDPYYKQLRKNGASGKEALSKFTTKGERLIWTWDGIKSESMTKIDSIKHYLSLLHTGLLAVNPKTGGIKSYVGGIDYGSFQYDNITSPRQVGSLFKPIVYLTALENGATPCDYYKNELRNYTSYQDWTPKNANEEYGGMMSLHHALTHSVNTVSVQVLFDAGIDNVIDVSKKLGIRSALNAVPSIVLGTSDVSLLEMVKAYGVLANDGIRTEPYCIERIEDKRGNILYDRSTNISDTLYADIDSTNLANINQFLDQVTKEGTGSRLYYNYKIPSTVKGKTGTTQNQSDGWFIGYTDDLVIGAWVGTEDRRMHFRNLGTGSGGRTALPMVGALFEYSFAENLISKQISSEHSFDCPGALSDEEYENYLRQKERRERQENFGGWLRQLLNGIDPHTGGTYKYNPNLKEQSNQRMKKYDKDKKRWDKRLQNKRKYRRD